ncbi:MAG: hypothetical protein A3K13_03925 [Gemmatimonadetes bacterium RIFCSPLOWO2_12_FULL_68_9]|nr:MAG: hypothetical protein A3K13_03925 [Gemmatimonadetes bacterium RIFCSPLOWO2_12_FULL_68_9]
MISNLTSMPHPIPGFVGLLLVAACGSSQPTDTAPSPTAPLPTAGLAGQRVVVYPLTLIAAHDTLGWTAALTPRRTALDHADSLLGETLTGRAPEVRWVLPPAVRQAARRAAPVAGDPDQMATSLLRGPRLRQLPEPLWSQMRNLTALAGDRYALVPASLLFVPAKEGGGRAELTLVLVDVRTGAVGWRTVANAAGADPWEALQGALKALPPGLP